MLVPKATSTAHHAPLVGFRAVRADRIASLYSELKVLKLCDDLEHFGNVVCELMLYSMDDCGVKYVL